MPDRYVTSRSYPCLICFVLISSANDLFRDDGGPAEGAQREASDAALAEGAPLRHILLPGPCGGLTGEAAAGRS